MCSGRGRRLQTKDGSSQFSRGMVKQAAQRLRKLVPHRAQHLSDPGAPHDHDELEEEHERYTRRTQELQARPARNDSLA